MARRFACSALVFASLTAVGCSQKAYNVDIYRDSWGVPSIVAKELPGVYYGLGYAHIADNGERMALNYKIARGRSAEVLGRSQLLVDGFLRGLEIEERAEKAELSGTAQMIVDAYIAGANQAIKDRRDRLAAWIQPITRTDVLSLTQFVNSAFPLLDLAGALTPGVGSNQFAISPKRSATGHPILSMDPHLDWNGGDGGIVWTEVGLYGPDLAFRGVSIPGLPAGLMGHNRKVAWSVTNNDPRLAVRFTVVPDPNNRARYSYHGEWKEFRTKQIRMGYRDGTEVKESTQTVRLTDWGPMVPLRSEAANVEPLGNFRGLEQSLAMMRARSVKEFRQALGQRGLSMWNFVFADTAGNTAYQYNATIRKRDASYDWSKAVRGDTPKTRLGALWSLDELPNVVNPRSGLLINANSAPWMTSLGGEMRKDWPAYVTSYGPTSRFEMLRALIESSGPVDPWAARLIATDTQIPYAKAAVRALMSGGNDSALSKIMLGWDGRSDIDSVGAAVYAFWLSQSPQMGALARKAHVGEKWSAEESQLAGRALQAGMTALTSAFGRADVKWGQVLRMRRGDREIGVSGYGGISNGAPAAVNPSGAFQRGPLTGKVIANRGSSWRMVVSLEPGGVRSWSVLPYGNSSDPASPYYANQMSLFATRRYKEVVFGAESARKAAVDHFQIHP